MSDESEALRALTQAREGVADRLDREAGWYDPLYALAVGLMIASQALPFPYGTVAIGVLLALLALLYKTQERRTGVRMWGITPKQARFVAAGLGLLCGGLMLASLWLMRSGQGWLGPLALGAVGATIAFLGAKLWRRVFRAELRGAL